MNLEKSERQLREILNAWGYRAVGNTHAMVHGAESGAIIIVKHEQQKRDLMARGVKREQLVSVDSLPESLMGNRKPVLVDHWVLSDLIATALSAAFEKGREAR